MRQQSTRSSSSPNTVSSISVRVRLRWAMPI
nr:MAG TPA: hypothetical protein [Caudoviricetes sp.]DAT34952.1 MAG TPA: hypothetical protein [Caudoviricetes sp.]